MELVIVLPPQVTCRAYDEFDESCIEKCDNGWFRVTAKVAEDNGYTAF